MGKFRVVVDRDVFKKAKKFLPKSNFSKFVDLINLKTIPFQLINLT